MVLWYNIAMKRSRGFTIIEVSLFLAITALLFVGITIGTQNSINQQRVADAVNGFADFLKNVYSEVSNPQSSGDGFSKQAIYGRLITFGEDNSIGKDESGHALQNEGKRGIFVYDVLGDISEDAGVGGGLETVLSKLNASVFAKVKLDDSGTTGTLDLAGEIEGYYPRWQSEIENTKDEGPIKAAILIVRHPRSGTINTLVMNGSTIQINKTNSEWSSAGGSYSIGSDGSCSSNCSSYNAAFGILKKELDQDKFKAETIDFCVDAFGNNASDRRNIRIIENARNASGVQVIDLDSTDNKCKK
jgi:hypothetical protein